MHVNLRPDSWRFEQGRACAIPKAGVGIRIRTRDSVREQRQIAAAETVGGCRVSATTVATPGLTIVPAADAVSAHRFSPVI
ncbi:MAG: hypothetical protein DRJ61_11750 [Acidobacteria bacterium]|nr:MAG: hypothetical protein DRJ65_15060 [Acidobacteriota bacterium]RLE31124.1 MAG: hypothetical protein DRJ61_11750 [Acidobacteriota bacterium]